MKNDKACPSCQDDAFTLTYVLTDPSYATAKCLRCGFIAMHPYPSDAFLHAHYKARTLFNSSQDRSAYDRAIIDRADLMTTLLRRAGRVSHQGKSVDFGAGVGIAVAAQKRLGFDAIGIETNPQAQGWGRDAFDVDIRDITLDEMGSDLSLFTMFEVLEHIKFPCDFLAKVKGHMAADGMLIGTVPNYNGLERYLRGRHSVALAWPEHVNQFTRATLTQTLGSAGFDVVYIGFPPPFGVVFSLGLRAWLRRQRSAGGLTPAIVALLTWIKKYLVYPLPNLFAETTGLLGHGLVFVARMPDGSANTVSALYESQT